MNLWLIEVDDPTTKKNIIKKIFEDEQEAKTYFKSQVENTKLDVRFYSPIQGD